MALGGVRFQGRTATGGFEVKYHKADASFDSGDDEFAGPQIDLGGWTLSGHGGISILRSGGSGRSGRTGGSQVQGFARPGTCTYLTHLTYLTYLTRF